MAPKAEPKIKSIAENRRGRYDYEIMETFEAGLSLTGTEVKSLRASKATIAESYAGPSGDEFFLFNCNIPEYLQANRFNHEPRRRRGLASGAWLARVTCNGGCLIHGHLHAAGPRHNGFIYAHAFAPARRAQHLAHPAGGARAWRPLHSVARLP